jgi:hypothetical protein
MSQATRYLLIREERLILDSLIQRFHLTGT